MSQIDLRYIPSEVRQQVAQLAADVIEQADSLGRDHWGMTAFVDAIRVNVGWTEILTATPEYLRLIVSKTALDADIPPGVEPYEGNDSRGFYPSVPGSICMEMEYRTVPAFEQAIRTLRPALLEAIRLAARRRAGRGVRAGHNQDAVQALEDLIHRALPAPAYARLLEQSNADHTELMEGALQRVVSSRYERNPAARRACIAHYGPACFICGFSFEKVYGEPGRGFIHVHHLTPISSIGKKYRIDPIEDLRPVCPNCHAMLHHKDPPLSLEEIQNLMSRNTAGQPLPPG